MPGYLTIFGTVPDSERALQAVRGLGHIPSMQPDGPVDHAWEALRIARGGGHLTLNWCDASRDPARFRYLQHGMVAYFEGIENAPQPVRGRALAHIRAASVAIGIVAQPEFAPDESDFDIVWAVNDAVGGMVWNGGALILPGGRILLDGDGNSDLVAG